VKNWLSAGLVIKSDIWLKWLGLFYLIRVCYDKSLRHKRLNKTFIILACTNFPHIRLERLKYR